MKKFSLSVIFFCTVISSFAVAETKNWTKFGSSWEVNGSTASTVTGYCSPWNYYELTNYNSLISINPIKNYSDIEVIAEIKERVETPSEFLISFNVTSESKNWFYHMYAFKITGGYWGMDKASLIFSDRADKSKSFETKNNTFVKELATTDCSIKYEKNYTYHIAFKNGNVILFINDEKILSAPFPEKNYDGVMAISSRNAKISIDRVTVKKGNKILFEDDFTEDTILIRQMKVERMPSVNNDKEAEK